MLSADNADRRRMMPAVVESLGGGNACAASGEVKGALSGAVTSEAASRTAKREFESTVAYVGFGVVG
jgi:hypothetical protein